MNEEDGTDPLNVGATWMRFVRCVFEGGGFRARLSGLGRLCRYQHCQPRRRRWLCARKYNAVKTLFAVTCTYNNGIASSRSAFKRLKLMVRVIHGKSTEDRSCPGTNTRLRGYGARMLRCGQSNGSAGVKPCQEYLGYKRLALGVGQILSPKHGKVYRLSAIFAPFQDFSTLNPREPREPRSSLQSGSGHYDLASQPCITTARTVRRNAHKPQGPQAIRRRILTALTEHVHFPIQPSAFSNCRGFNSFFKLMRPLIGINLVPRMRWAH